jgi:hypothetical protein
MAARKSLAFLALLGLAALPAAAAPAQDGPSRHLANQQAQAHAAAAFPTWWIGEFPPFPPFGYRWQFSHLDFWGNACWYLVRG